jgi:hypothetical protein
VVSLFKPTRWTPILHGKHRYSQSVDRAGETITGEDLLKNTNGLADHLKLTGEERSELFATIRGWIADDYSAERLILIERGADRGTLN